jgi:hypothetical protein
MTINGMEEEQNSRETSRKKNVTPTWKRMASELNLNHGSEREDGKENIVSDYSK